jgi:hypothetical protein
LLFNFALECVNRKVQDNQLRLELNGIYLVLVYTDDVNILRKNLYTIKKNKEAPLWASKDVGLEPNTEKMKYIVMFHHQNSGKLTIY